MKLRLQWVREDRPGRWWAAQYQRTSKSYRAWFLQEGDRARPDLSTCRTALEEHMPELVPLWERLSELAGGGDQAARMLSLYRPTAYLAGCSQAARGGPDPLLVRNYDYHPEATEGTFLASTWTGTRVIGASDCLWGLLDGMNERGLAVALSFGGRKQVGDGFGIPLILRYVLELCTTVGDAARVLERVPSHMSYNLSLLDASGSRAVVRVAPDRPTLVLEDDVATNHQGVVEWTRYAEHTQSEAREDLLREHVSAPSTSDEELIELFLRPPLFRTDYARSSGTIYTAAYRPRTGQVDYIWPSTRIRASFDHFEETSMEVRAGA